MDEIIMKEKRNLEEYEVKIIDLQKQRSKEEGKAQQMQRERNGLITKN
jgi:hypothetical protein